MARSDSPAVVAPGAPVDLRGVSSYDRIAHGGDDLELPREMCQRVHCLVGVNADFHDLSSKEPLGGVVSSGPSCAPRRPPTRRCPSPGTAASWLGFSTGRPP